VDVFTDTVFVMGAGTLGGGTAAPADIGIDDIREAAFGLGPTEGLRLIDTLSDGPVEGRTGVVVAVDGAEEQDWQERALCAQTDPEAFFPEKGGSTREAKRICAGCEVRAECLEYALQQDERFGIWGGLSERERRRLRRAAV
jgi:WhiB family transcriptional regulator, redox-sensing transcriptional regulator